MSDPRPLPRRIYDAIVLRHERTWHFPLALTVLFGLFNAYAHVIHEPWRDELHCWGVGQNATSFGDLLEGERRYDGHPFLWYFLLRALSKIVPPLVGLHGITIAFATATAWLWARYAPLPRWLRVLTLGSYYLAFEYTAFSRAYVLTLLCVAAFGALYTTRAPRLLALSVALSLLASTSAYGFVIACALAAMLYLSTLHVDAADDIGGGVRARLPRGWVPGIALFVFTLGFVIVTTVPPPDEYFAAGTHTSVDSGATEAALRRFWDGMAPLPPLDRDFWNRNVTAGAEWVPKAAAALVFLLLLGFHRQGWVLLSFVLGAGVMAAFQHMKFAGSTRHLGHYFVLVWIAVWIHSIRARKGWPRFVLEATFTLVVLVQCVGASRALRMDREHPFSDAVEAAKALAAPELLDLPVVAARDHATSGLAVLTNRRFYYTETREDGVTVVFHNRRIAPTNELMLSDATRLARQTGKDAVIVADFPVAGSPPGFELVSVHAPRAPTIVADEGFWIYRLKHRKAP